MSRRRSARPRHARMQGYLLPEVLCALVILGLGLLPLAAAGVAGLQWLREQAALAQAMRVVAEAAERQALRDEGAPLASRHAASGLMRGPRPCAAAPTEGLAAGCVPGNRLSVVGLVPHPVPSAPAPSAGLRAIALWLAP